MARKSLNLKLDRRRNRSHQRRLPEGGSRFPTMACLDPKQRAWVVAQADRFGCWPSHVLNTAVSFISKIPLECEAFDQVDRKRKKA